MKKLAKIVKFTENFNQYFGSFFYNFLWLEISKKYCNVLFFQVISIIERALLKKHMKILQRLKKRFLEKIITLQEFDNQV